MAKILSILALILVRYPEKRQTETHAENLLLKSCIKLPQKISGLWPKLIDLQKRLMFKYGCMYVCMTLYS